MKPALSPKFLAVLKEILINFELVSASGTRNGNSRERIEDKPCETCPITEDHA